MEIKLTWRDVLDCGNRKHWYGLVNKAADTARSIGYKYFLFNNRVYEIIEDTYIETGLFEVDIH